MPYVDLKDISPKEIVRGFNARFIHTERMTLAYVSIEAGAALPGHHHPHEQVTNILSGEFELTLGAETRVMRPGDVAVIPPDLPHSGKAVTDCEVLDVFQPVREDYRS